MVSPLTLSTDFSTSPERSVVNSRGRLVLEGTTAFFGSTIRMVRRYGPRFSELLRTTALQTSSSIFRGSTWLATPKAHCRAKPIKAEGTVSSSSTTARALWIGSISLGMSTTTRRIRLRSILRGSTSAVVSSEMISSPSSTTAVMNYGFKESRALVLSCGVLLLTYLVYMSGDVLQARTPSSESTTATGSQNGNAYSGAKRMMSQVHLLSTPPESTSLVGRKARDNGRPSSECMNMPGIWGVHVSSRLVRL